MTTLATKWHHVLRDKKLMSVAVAALIIGGVAGYGLHGITNPTRPGMTGQFGANIGNRAGITRSFDTNARANGLLTGTITSASSGSLVLDTRDGSSHIVLITPDTTVSKSVTGSLSDLTTGSMVIVTGTTNQDGSVSANLIQLRPAPATPRLQ